MEFMFSVFANALIERRKARVNDHDIAPSAVV